MTLNNLTYIGVPQPRGAETHHYGYYDIVPIGQTRFRHRICGKDLDLKITWVRVAFFISIWTCFMCTSLVGVFPNYSAAQWTMVILGGSTMLTTIYLGDILNNAFHWLRDAPDIDFSNLPQYRRRRASI